MSQIPSLLSTQSASNQAFGASNTLNDLNVDTFLKLMITELQNQDPLNPMENDEILAQISQIREIGSNEKLTSTLESVLLGQNIASATNLIGADVDAISNTNERVSGRVARVSITGGKPELELDLTTQAAAQLDPGDIEPGEYSYRVVWETQDGLQGIELSGEDAVSTRGSVGNQFPSIRLENLPTTEGPKRIYRTDKSGEGDYLLVATAVDGSRSSYLDTTGDDDRSQTRQTQPFFQDPTYRIRNFKISLNNVASIRPPN